MCVKWKIRTLLLLVVEAVLEGSRMKYQDLDQGEVMQDFFTLKMYFSLSQKSKITLCIRATEGILKYIFVHVFSLLNLLIVQEGIGRQCLQSWHSFFAYSRNCIF